MRVDRTGGLVTQVLVFAIGPAQDRVTGWRVKSGRSDGKRFVPVPVHVGLADSGWTGLLSEKQY